MTFERIKTVCEAIIKIRIKRRDEISVDF